MDLKIGKKLIRNLASAADIVNTMDGGVIFPTFNITKEENHYRLEIGIPSVNPDDIKIEVNKSHLFVYQKMEYKDIRIPNMLGIQRITADVELENITAGYENDLLVVIMPFNELTGGPRREINILKN